MSDLQRLDNESLGGRFNIMGINQGVSTTLQDLTGQGGVFVWPQAASTLSIVSTSAQDTVAGTNARRVTVVGLDANFNLISEVVAMNGLTPVITTQQFIRVNELFVSASGVYGRTQTNSHNGTITATHTGSGVIMRTIPILGTLAFGKSQDSLYTVPVGYTLYVFALWANAETDKLGTVYFNRRINADIFSGDRAAVVTSFAFLKFFDTELRRLAKPVLIPAKTDLWASGLYATGTGTIAVDVECALVKSVP